ncbi:protease HtpX, partial [Streptomyces sp. SID12501]|nr:protease HtpX [Streptomyces sp. SID12501]
MGHRHYNGLKTAALFGALWAVLLGIGWLVGGPRYLWLFTLAGLAMTAYSYWNSDKIAIRAMRARPVSELEQPA